MKRYIVTAVALVAVAVLGVWMYRNFSPYHVCLRYYKIEATEAGQSRETAEDYAENLCKAKNPLRN